MRIRQRKNIFNEHISLPLEREYEGWIANGIENYFEKLKVETELWSISPLKERTWPADIRVELPFKIVGLQIKRPMIDKNAPSKKAQPADRLCWDMSSQRQYQLVSSFPEIYYCLPCFVNREYRKHALSHCLFGKPDSPHPVTKIWYDNNKAKISLMCKEMRWGLFFERVVMCNIGVPIVNIEQISEYFERLRKKSLGYLEKLAEEGNSEEEKFSSTILYLAVECPLEMT